MNYQKHNKLYKIIKHTDYKIISGKIDHNP